MKRLLIANRGEIALRVQRTCIEMGIETVAAYAEVDRDLPHLEFADDTIRISDADYRCRENLVAAAKITGCDAVHPGYGFLSEDADFAHLVEDQGLVFIGPSPHHIQVMGNKVRVREAMAELGVASVPGSATGIESVAEARQFANEAGFPVVVKAAFGGGGRGIRLVRTGRELEHAFAEANSEAAAAFGDGTLYIEKYLDRARHIEVQVIGDGSGGAIHLGTRECSIQRRQQKVIEEAPAANIEPDQVDALCERSVHAVAALQYRNAGTLEFLYHDGEFFFLEMNTRLQVEHPVTEQVTGLDLVRLQIETAQQGSLPLGQGEVHLSGCAIECRLNAEDDEHRPSPGTITSLRWPAGPGVRIDTHLYPGYRVPHQFDSLVAKLVASSQDRPGAIARMQRMLQELQVEGISTNRVSLGRVLTSGGFRRGEVHIRFLDELMGSL